MYNHTSEKYLCPICVAIQGVEDESTWIKQADLFYQNEFALGFIGSKAIKGNEGHPLIVPLKHFENLYDLPEEYGHAIFSLAKDVAMALKRVRGWDGVTLVQNNEPAGDQHAFHYHLHVIPRFEGDHFHEELWKTEILDPATRSRHAEALRSALAQG